MTALASMLVTIAITNAWLYLDPNVAVVVTMLGLAMFVGYFDAKWGRQSNG